MPSDPPSEVRRAGTTFGAAIVGGLRRAWATDKGRRRIALATGAVVVILTIAIAAALFASLAGESQSYRDGYSAGGSAYTAYSGSGVTAEEACREEETGPGGRPTLDNSDQWVRGCVDAYNLAGSGN